MARELEKQTCENQIRDIVSELFVTMLKTEVALTAEPDPDHASVVTAAIEFGGSWKGVLELGCSHAQAVCFAQRFLQMDVNELDQEVHDTIGELANIIAGNLKLILPPSVSLGTPKVVRREGRQLSAPNGHVVGRYSFASDVGMFSVRVIEEHRDLRSGL